VDLAYTGASRLASWEHESYSRFRLASWKLFMLLLVKPPVGREMLRRQGIAPAVGRDCSGVGGVGERKEVRQTDQLIFFLICW
jgi:hypothetical protein